MNANRMTACASRAANAAFRAMGGPREFSWAETLNRDGDNSAERLAAIIQADPNLTPAQLYARVIAGDANARDAKRPPAPWSALPLSLQVAVEVFRSSVLALLPRVAAAESAERAARPTNILQFEARS